jgi:hypothetical protein
MAVVMRYLRLAPTREVRARNATIAITWSDPGI